MAEQATISSASSTTSSATSFVDPFAPSRAPYVFEPPPGGDILLRTADDKLFCLHSVILGLASSVFSDMFAVGTESKEVINLADDSESLSLMLGFTYPSVVFPIIDTFGLLEKSLTIAQKYHVTPMIQRIDRSISHESFYKHFIQTDPLHLFKLCAAHGLRETQTAAARLVRAGPYDLLYPDSIIKFAKRYPSASHIIGMLGAQLIRVSTLRQALLGVDKDSFTRVRVDKVEFEWMICDSCRGKHITDEDIPFSYYPGWLRAWSVFAFDILSTRSWDDSSFLFTAGVLERLPTPNPNEEFCEACVEVARNARGGRTFEAWAAEVEGHLDLKLRQLEDLYVL